MADKPLYYGSSSKSPLYYGADRPAYPGGAGSRAMYYGASAAYGGAYGGSYGAYGAYGGVYGGSSGAGSDGSIVGTITFGRMLRVISQRWLSVFVFQLVGLIISFEVYGI